MLGGMVDCPIAISFLMISHILSFVVLCTGTQNVITLFCLSSHWWCERPNILTKFCFSDGVDEYTVNRFLSQIFSNEADLRGKVYSLVKESASRKFDMKEEVPATSIFLQLRSIRDIKLFVPGTVRCISRYMYGLWLVETRNC